MVASFYNYKGFLYRSLSQVFLYPVPIPFNIYNILIFS